jgi:hypothetical protein
MVRAGHLVDRTECRRASRTRYASDQAALAGSDRHLVIILSSGKRAPTQQGLCHNCGAAVSVGTRHCDPCSVTLARENLAKGAQLGRVRAQLAWDPSTLPAWLDSERYVNRVRPLLEGFSRPAIASAINVAIDHAGEVRAGRFPHPRHWLALAELVGVEG